MSIKVQTKLVTYSGNRFIRGNSYANNFVSMDKSNIRSQNNSLVDMNYSSLLVKNNNVSFTGGAVTATKAVPKAVAKVVVSIADKINGIIPKLEINNVLVVAKDLESGKKIFKDSISCFDGAINKLYLAFDSEIEGAFAFHKKGPNMHEFLNLADSELAVELPGAPAFKIKKGEYGNVFSGDKIITKNKTIELSYADKATEKAMIKVEVAPINKVGFNSGIYEKGFVPQPKVVPPDAPGTKPRYTIGFNSEIYKK